MTEGLTRYLPRYLPALLPASEEPSHPGANGDAQAEVQGLGDLRAFLQLALKQTPRVQVALWPSQAELAAGVREPGWDHAMALCDELAIPCISLWEPVQAALSEGGKPFWDNIHPNAEGQKLIESVLLGSLKGAFVQGGAVR